MLLTAFIVLSPLVIAYSLGYTINFSTRTIEQRGGIFIKSKIPRISLFLNNEFRKETSFFSGGALLTEIPPGTHLLRLEKENYHSWSKTITVEQARVTEIRNILLAPLRLATATATRDEIALLTPATSTPSRTLRLDKKKKLVEDHVVNNRATTTILAPSVNSFANIKGMIFFIGETGFAAKIGENGITETLGRPGFFLSRDTPAQFFLSPRKELAILDAGGGLFILGEGTNETKPLDGGVKEIAFDTEGEKLLIVKERSIEIAWRADNEYQPFQKKGTLEQILALQTSFLNASWHFEDDAHIIIRTNDGIYLTEIDGRGGRNTVELFSGKTSEILTSLGAPNTIYFRKENTWHRIEL